MDVDFPACLLGFPVKVTLIQSVELSQKRNSRTREATNGKQLHTSQFAVFNVNLVAIYYFTRLGMFVLLRDNVK